MISWIIIVAGLIASWHYTDIESEITFYSRICPFFVFIFLVSLLIKVVVLIGPETGNRSGGGYFGSSDGSSDWGGDD